MNQEVLIPLKPSSIRIICKQFEPRCFKSETGLPGWLFIGQISEVWPRFNFQVGWP